MPRDHLPFVRVVVRPNGSREVTLGPSAARVLISIVIACVGVFPDTPATALFDHVVALLARTGY
jgi:hypothetical protein